MREAKFFNPNYSEDEVWDLLSEYLEKKHQANTSTIQRGIYADNNNDGSIFLLEDENEYASLYCYRNFNFNVSGTIVFPFDTSLNDEFDLGTICQYLSKPFPKPPTSNFSLTDEQMEERKENIRLLKLKQSNEEIQSYNKAKVKSIAIAMLYALEFFRAKSQDNRAYHFGQITRSVEDSKYIKVKRINDLSDGVVIASTPTSEKEYLSFLNENKDLIRSLGVDFDLLFEMASGTIAKSLDQIITKDARKLGSIIFPLRNIDGLVISAMIVLDTTVNNGDFTYLKYETYTHSSLQFGDCTDEAAEIIILTTDHASADTLRFAIPEVCVIATLSQANMSQTIKELQNKYPDKILIVAIDNEYTRTLSKQNIKAFIQSDLCRISQHLADNIKDCHNVGVIYPPSQTETSAISFCDVLHEYGEDHLKEQLDHVISELAERRSNKVLELNHLLEVYAEAHDTIRNQTGLSLPPLVILDQDEDTAATISTDVPLINTKANNPVLFQESRTDFRNWINRANTKSLAAQDENLRNAMCRFVKEALPIEIEDIEEILCSKGFYNNESPF